MYFAFLFLHIFEMTCPKTYIILLISRGQTNIPWGCIEICKWVINVAECTNYADLARQKCARKWYLTDRIQRTSLPGMSSSVSAVPSQRSPVPRLTSVPGRQLLEKAGISATFLYSDLDPAARKINTDKFRHKRVSRPVSVPWAG